MLQGYDAIAGTSWLLNSMDHVTHREIIVSIKLHLLRQINTKTYNYLYDYHFIYDLVTCHFMRQSLSYDHLSFDQVYFLNIQELISFYN